MCRDYFYLKHHHSSKAKRISLMRYKLIFIYICLPFLIFANGWENRTPQEKWQLANVALQKKNYRQAITLYKDVLGYCKNTNNASGMVNAMEAIAIAYKKQDNYSEAKNYCQRALRTGKATYRAYYTLAQIAFERYRDIGEATRYCTEGLRHFSGNKDLLSYRKYLKNQSMEPSMKPVHTSVKKAPATQTLKKHKHTAMELEVIREMNLARQNPAAYARHLEKLRPYYSGELLRIPGQTPERTHEGVSALNEAVEFLKRARPLPSLKLSTGMSLAARDHARDQGRSGQTGHIGGDGSKPYERMERFGNWEGLSGENIAYGDDSARMFVMKLIIDDGVPQRGHRENIFNHEFRVAGVSIGTHPIYRTMCVITYATGYLDK